MPHGKFSEVTQLKKLHTEVDRDGANGRVNFSIQLEDVAGRYLFSLDLDRV